ncbi:MAG: type II secretion system protein GspI [Robiginitomaculum sp.]|nr:MAG: type II secretion system protein GspI [Robiginitomaculum sp.]
MHKHMQRGFTLVEVLVSLVIFSTAIIGLMQAGTQNARAVYIAQQKQLAGMIADNQLILATHTNAPTQIGTQQDSVQMAGRQWHWQIRTEETSQAGFYKLIITIREDGSEQIIMTRTAYSEGRA